jgi:hypothetical protein
MTVRTQQAQVFQPVVGVVAVDVVKLQRDRLTEPLRQFASGAGTLEVTGGQQVSHERWAGARTSSDEPLVQT